MEVSIGCGSAAISIVDDYYVPVVEFSNVRVIGNASYCDQGYSNQIMPFVNNQLGDTFYEN
jgi:hypothetical protein